MSPPTISESLIPTKAGSRVTLGFNSDCIIKALKNKSVVRKDQEGRERLIVLIPGRRNADVKFTSLRNCAKGVGKAMGSGNLVETFQL